MKLRTTFLTVLVLLALIIGSTVQAQDFDPCFGLGDDDCAVIDDASANGLGDAESFTMEMSIDFAAAGVDTIGALAGSFTGDPSAADSFPAEVTFGFDSTMDFAMDDSELGIYMNGTMTISYAVDGEGEEQALDVMLVDDVLYINDGSTWLSVDMLAILEDEELNAQFGALMEDSDPEAAMEDLGLDSSSLAILFGILDLDGFLNYERDGDDFVFTVDFGALQALLEEENAELLEEITTSAAQVDPMMAGMIAIVPALITDGNIVITQSVDTDANMVTDIVVESELELALGMLAGTTDTTTTDLTVEISMGNLDGVEMVDAPEDAIDVTEPFLEGLKSGMSQ